MATSWGGDWISLFPSVTKNEKTFDFHRGLGLLSIQYFSHVGATIFLPKSFEMSQRRRQSVSFGLSSTSQQLMGRKAFERFMGLLRQQQLLLLLLSVESEKLRENVNWHYAISEKIQKWLL